RACGSELIERGLGPRQKALAGFSQTNAARRADEQCCADPRLQCPDRLANRRRSNPKIGRSSAKAAVLRNAQERLDAIKRALSDCEVLLHSPSTLSRIVGRWKRSYLPVANPERSFPHDLPIARRN